MNHYRNNNTNDNFNNNSSDDSGDAAGLENHVASTTNLRTHFHPEIHANGEIPNGVVRDGGSEYSGAVRLDSTGDVAGADALSRSSSIAAAARHVDNAAASASTSASASAAAT